MSASSSGYRGIGGVASHEATDGENLIATSEGTIVRIFDPDNFMNDSTPGTTDIAFYDGTMPSIGAAVWLLGIASNTLHQPTRSIVSVGVLIRSSHDASRVFGQCHSQPCEYRRHTSTRTRPHSPSTATKTTLVHSSIDRSMDGTQK
jgi:hypothetical protein